MEFQVPAVRTLADVAAQVSGLAVHDGEGGLVLHIRQIRSITGILMVRGLKNLPDMMLTHEKRRRGGQRG